MIRPNGANLVEGDRLLFRVGKIERAQWFDVVDMPLTAITPRHSW